MIDLKRSLTLPQLQRGAKGRAGKSKRGPLLVAAWDQTNLYVLLVNRRQEPIVAADWGTLAIGNEQPPLAQLREWADEREHRVEQLLLLMPRAQLEMVNVEVPDAEADELSALVATEVEGQIGDGEHELVIDYCKLEQVNASGRGSGTGEPSDDMRGSVTAVGFAADGERLTQWQRDAEAQQFQLVAITARQLAPLAALRRRREVRGRSTVVVTVYSGEVELSFFRGERMIFLRTFRASVTSPGALAEQIQLEIQRSLSTMDFVHDDQPPELVLIDRDMPAGEATGTGDTSTEDVGMLGDDWRDLREALDARLVRLELALQPGVRVGGRSAVSPDPALIGAALEYTAGELAVDLLNPKKPVEPPNPWKRRGGIATLALGSMAVVGYFLISDVAALRSTVSSKQQELERAQGIADKFQEKGDEARYVQQWLADKVDWLSELRLLSAQFPSGQGANVRRLSAAANGEAGVFDLSIQVSDPARVAELENRLREAGFSVTSQQISEQSGNSEYPWQFEARVAFAITDLEEREEQMQLREDPSILLANVESQATDEDGQGASNEPSDDPSVADKSSPSGESPPNDEGSSATGETSESPEDEPSSDATAGEVEVAT